MTPQPGDATTQPAEGWAFPARSTKAHYIRDTFSLCRKYGFYRAQLEEDDGKPSKDDCATCRRMLDAEKTQ